MARRTRNRSCDLMLVAAPGLSDSIGLATGIGAKPVVATDLGPCQRLATALAGAIGLAPLAPQLFARGVKLCSSLCRRHPTATGCSDLGSCLERVLPPALAAAMARLPVVLTMASLTQCHPVRRVVCVLGIVALGFDMRTLEWFLLPTALTLAASPSEHGELPRPPPLFRGSVLAYWNDVFVVDHSSHANSHVGRKGGDA